MYNNGVECDGFNIFNYQWLQQQPVSTAHDIAQLLYI